MTKCLIWVREGVKCICVPVYGVKSTRFRVIERVEQSYEHSYFGLEEAFQTS